MEMRLKFIPNCRRVFGVSQKTKRKDEKHEKNQ